MIRNAFPNLLVLLTAYLDMMRIEVESGLMVLLTSDLLLKSAITLSPETFGVETKTIGECLTCAVRFLSKSKEERCGFQTGF